MDKLITGLILTATAAFPATGLTISESVGDSDVTRTRSLTQSAAGLDFYREDITFELSGLSLSPGDDISINLNFPEPLNLEGYFTSADFTLRLILFNGPIISGSNQGIPEDVNLVGLANATSSNTFSGGWDGPDFINLVGSASIFAPFGENTQLDAITWDLTAPAWVDPDSTVDLRFLVSQQFRTDTIIDPQRNLITFIPEPGSLALLGLGGLLLARRPR